MLIGKYALQCLLRKTICKCIAIYEEGTNWKLFVILSAVICYSLKYIHNFQL